MIPIINFTKPFAIIVALILFILIVILGKETKKSIIPGFMLGTFLIIIAGHAIEYALVKDATGEILTILARCISMDFIFILISFFAYLWIDDIETKEKKKKSIDNSLDWFWKKV